ncbi:MAG: zf-TFIIB domain-containing protein, partial [Myxococcota bacterium]
QGPRARSYQVKAEPQKGPMYRKCPECSSIMNRENYGRRSGVIIDICPEHGIWFDNQELDSILEWIRDGGHNAPKVTSRTPSRPQPAAPFSARVSPTTSTSAATFDRVTDLLFSLFS